MPIIPYYSANFPTTFGRQGQGNNLCSCTWAEIIWAALTVGKANCHYLVRHGLSSVYEFYYRAFIIYANLRQGATDHIHRTGAYDALDPSEKSAISYFIGLTSAKLFAEKYLSISWLMHLDVYRESLPIEMCIGRVKPDMIGLTNLGEWAVLEAKGRTNALASSIIYEAKNQTRRVRRIDGRLPVYRIAFASFFNMNTLNVHWEDPNEYNEKSFDVKISYDRLLTFYYMPIINLFSDRKPKLVEINKEAFQVANLRDADLTVGVSKKILFYLITKDHKSLLSYLKDKMESLTTQQNRKIGLDGVLVELGKKWSNELMKLESLDRAGEMDGSY